MYHCFFSCHYFDLDLISQLHLCVFRKIDDTCMGREREREELLHFPLTVNFCFFCNSFLLVFSQFALGQLIIYPWP